MRKLRGPMADWDLHAMLLRQVDLRLAGANWQRSGGKGQRPRPIELPSEKQKKQAATRPVGGDIAQRLKNLGLVPAGAAQGEAPTG